MENFLKAVRKAAGLSQVQMAQAIGRSHQMVAAYERGAPMPDDVLAAVKNVAAKAGRSDLAGELAPGRVSEPDAVSISAGRASGGAPLKLHEFLDEIWRAEDKDAMDTTASTLAMFSKYVRAGISPKKKRRVK